MDLDLHHRDDPCALFDRPGVSNDGTGTAAAHNDSDRATARPELYPLVGSRCSHSRDLPPGRLAFAHRSFMDEVAALPRRRGDALLGRPVCSAVSGLYDDLVD